MVAYLCFWMAYVCFFFVSKRANVSCEVQFITAEIKRNNITIPNRFVSGTSNTTNGNASNKNNVDKDKAKPSKGEKKSEVYVVNNGLLLLHPKKVITTSGVKKSTEPVPPPSINYHVIRKLKNNGTEANTGPKLLENHLRKRSLSTRLQRGHKKKKKHVSKLETATKRLGIPSVSHGRIISVNKNDRYGKKSHKILSFFSHSKNRTHREKINKVHSNDNSKKAGIGQIRGSSEFLHEKNEKRADIEDPLFDSDQTEYVELAKQTQSQKGEQGVKRSKKPPRKGIPSIKDIPDIKKYFDKPLQVHEYPRFVVRPFPGTEFPRFPISTSALSIYPRFALSPQNTQILHRFPVHRTALTRYPRYPYIKPVVQFPRYEKGEKRFTEYPRFEEIKPIPMQEFPRFPEPKPIPEIKEIENADKRGKSKRGEILHIPKYSPLKHFPDINHINFVVNDKHYDDDGGGDDDDDDDDDDGEAYERTIGSRMKQGYPLIAPIGTIAHIATPPGIPEIADIPFLPEIPPLHGIHGIKPISPIKSIPQSEKTGSSRSLPTEAKDIAKIQSNNVSIKDLAKDSNTV